MAKQTGLYGIRGKVNGYSYYKQTGVADTIFRRINEGMSDRVKRGAEYANTRLNNIEFSQACKLAGIMGKMVQPKYRPMILPFSQSNMAKQVLEVLKADPTALAQWGYRGLSLGTNKFPAEILAGQSKLAFSDFVDTLAAEASTPSLGRSNVEFTWNFQEGIADLLGTYGADGVTVRCLVWNVVYKRPDANTFAPATINLSAGGAGEQPFQIDTEEHDMTINARYPVNVPSGAVVKQIGVVIVMPTRTVGGTKHVLQEACSFTAFEIETA